MCNLTASKSTSTNDNGGTTTDPLIHVTSNGVIQEAVDVIILGAGAAGLAAARTLLGTSSNVSCVVLEGRNRVGGRAFGTNVKGQHLDHGARWIHGASMANPMIQLVHELGLEHQLVRNAQTTKTAAPAATTGVNTNVHETITQSMEPRDGKGSFLPDLVAVDSSSLSSSPPSTSSSSSSYLDDAIVAPYKEEHACHVEETCDDVAEMDPEATLLRILTTKSENNSNIIDSIQSSEPSPQALFAAQQVMEEVLAVFEQVNNSHDHSNLKLQDLSLQEVLQHTYTPKQGQGDIWEHIIRQNVHVQSYLASLPLSQERDAFVQECVACFNVEVNQFFENWEGAPIHRISAKYGLENTILPGGNAWLADIGYSGLLERAAEALTTKETVCHDQLPHDNRQQQRIAKQTALPEQPLIRLNHHVVSVSTLPPITTAMTDPPQHPRVVVTCRVGDLETGHYHMKEFHASACIVALPLGVLRDAVSLDEQPQDEYNNNTTPRLRFTPPLPPSLCQSINNLGIAVMDKVEMAFPYRWWPENIQRIALACSHLQQSPSFHPWTSFIVESSSNDGDDGDEKPNVLVCYLHGDFAMETENKSDDRVQQECLQVLRQANLTVDEDTVPDPIAFHVTRWLQDPYSRGSWTFYCKGSTPQDVRNFRENGDCNARGLFFAGEHTCSGTPHDDDDVDTTPSIPGDDLGCLHGAWLSGELAAKAMSQWLATNKGHAVVVPDFIGQPYEAIPKLAGDRFLEPEGQSEVV